MSSAHPPPVTGEAVGSRLTVKARKLLARGEGALRRLPSPADLDAADPASRHQRLEALRLELYAVSSILAEEAVDRAEQARGDHPPYGLVRSGHTDWRMVLASPATVAEGDLTDFYGLGKAYVDTVVFHLDRAFTALRSDRGWMLDRLEQLLALFRTDAPPSARGRLRDGLSFIYGGLHFGTGVSVQLVEVMHRLLAGRPGMTAAAQAEVIGRSGRPAFRLAALSLDHVIVAYHAFLGPPAHPGGPQWFDPDRFSVDERDGAPWRIDFAPAHLAAGKPHVARLDGIVPTYETHGCPARISPAGATPPIARLWSWCVDLAHDAGLLGPNLGTRS